MHVFLHWTPPPPPRLVSFCTAVLGGTSVAVGDAVKIDLELYLLLQTCRQNKTTKLIYMQYAPFTSSSVGNYEMVNKERDVLTGNRCISLETALNLTLY